jgi:hypothetical protein
MLLIFNKAASLEGMVSVFPQPLKTAHTAERATILMNIGEIVPRKRNLRRVLGKSVSAR